MFVLKDDVDELLHSCTGIEWTKRVRSKCVTGMKLNCSIVFISIRAFLICVVSI